ncbi:MAG: adaptor protein MecA [Lachnospiraceae bacterium]
MDFQRIDKNTVQCRMTEEEMNEYGFEIEDFFTNQEKSRAFLEQIVERAEEEVGYEVESGMISMQLMRMPDNSLMITFSDHGDESLQNMLHHLQNLAGLIDESSVETVINGLLQDWQGDKGGAAVQDVHMSENIDEQEKTGGKKFTEADKAAYQKHLKEIERITHEKEKKKLSAAKLFRFNSLHDLEFFASTVSYSKPGTSRVYKDKAMGDYYLFIKKGKLKVGEFDNLCNYIKEYGELCINQPYAEQYCKEHFECLIPKHALKVLQEY